MKKICRLFCGWMTAFCILTGFAANFPLPAYAARSGSCGENLTWILDDEGTLIISGTGPMDNYESSYLGDYEDISVDEFMKWREQGKDLYISSAPWCYPGRYLISSVIIEEGVTSIGDMAFSDCVFLTNITIPDSVTSIGKMAFSGCTALTSITIPDAVETIGIETFSHCESLARVSLPANLKNIEGNAFIYCKALESIVIPDGTTSIGESAFGGCGKLMDIKIPDSVKAIGSGAFHACSSLTSVIIPDGVTDIGESLFDSCTSLKIATLPDGLETIAPYMFVNCESLTFVTIPDTVTSIEKAAFYGCFNLTDVYYYGTEKEWNKISIKSPNYGLSIAAIHYDTPKKVVKSEENSGSNPIMPSIGSSTFSGAEEYDWLKWILAAILSRF
ncbi:MAG TPA: leucine-rich repeat domain-containing protein [Candidatus Avimonoglobus intestinipullorum]|uniref:Leucine-rich repeat domain-containing protein n=1 Tax=Candidatus Avimonoglobus intestinipullorum TaxID=2840699 RepID=A0A9D1LVL0_9FIRM|nr:leucine-rich repeat domain-containing protein [Candidatus Avimonoglobus intestinipullorum]